MYKKVVVLQSCYFANLNLLLFCRSGSGCGRRRHCLSSPLLWSRNFATIVAWRHTSPLHCNDKRESWDREENTQSSPWDKYVNFSNLKLEINQKMVSGEVRKYLFSTVVKKGFNNSHLQLQHSTFFCFEAVARVLDDVSNKRLKFADRSLELYFRLITTTQKITLLVKFTCPGQRPIIPSLSSYTIPWGSVFYTVWREEPTIGSVTADLAD